MKRNFKRYCKNYQDIENYKKAKVDDFVGWHCHHRLETHTPDGKRRGADISRNELIALGLYYNRPPEELIFLTTMGHISLHKKGKTYRLGKYHTEESRIKMSKAHKGKYTGENHPMYGKSPWNKGKKLSEETKKKLSEAHKGNKNNLGTRWYNNGKINIRVKECPEGFVPGRLR